MAAVRFFDLAIDERKEALEVAASNSGRPAFVLEKDAWVVWTLNALFRSPVAQDLIFKGGTSLSKVYQAIDRFSEDIDVTYDIRAIAPELVKDAGPDALPPNASQARKWRDNVEDKLSRWLREQLLPYVQGCVETDKLQARVTIGEAHSLRIDYATEVSGYGYVGHCIKIEFGARSTGEPTTDAEVSCDAAPHLRNVIFPTAKPRVMRVERTAWEKMTAIHVFCLQGQIRNRLARHWSDITRLHLAGHIEAALQDRDIARRVADHKSKFFVEKDAQGGKVDYHRAVNGGLVLVPQGEILKELQIDYVRMVEDRLFLGDPEPLEWVIARCAEIQVRANDIACAGARS